MADWEHGEDRRRRRATLAAAAGVAVIGLAITTWANDTGSAPPEGGIEVDHDTDPPPGPEAAERSTEAEHHAPDAREPDPDAEPIGEWRSLAPAPLAPGDVAASAWTGEELLVWRGKADQFAAYDPHLDEWRGVAEAPVYAAGRTGALWTGEELVVLGAYGEWTPSALPDQGAAYHPDTDSWRSIAPAPEGDWSWDAAVWDGQAIIVVGARFSDGRGTDPSAVAYDPDRDAWDDLPPPPVWNWSGWLLAAVVEGHVVVIGERASAHPDAGERALAVYDPREREWTELEPTPYGGLWSVGMASVEPPGRAAVVGGVHDDVWHDVNATWSPDEGLRWDGLPPRPYSGQRAPALLDTDHGLVAWTWGAEDAWLLDDDERQWRPLSEGPLGPRRDAALAWTGDELLVWGGRSGQKLRGDGAAWRITNRASLP